MIEQGDGVAAAVTGRISQLFANLGAALAVPKELNGSQLPGDSCSWRRRRRVVRQSRGHMAGRAGYGFGTGPTYAAMDIHAMDTILLFTGGRPNRNTTGVDMAICAARMGNNRLDPFPCFQTCRTADAARRQGIPRTFTFCVDHHRKRGQYRSSNCDGNQSPVHDRPSQTKSMNLLNGISRMRLPVAAKMALASAGAAGGTGGSPMPRTV